MDAPRMEGNKENTAATVYGEKQKKGGGPLIMFSQAGYRNWKTGASAGGE